jgi:N-acetylgalactosamine 4-sulfate 6-O-sulfotransferase
MKEKDDYLLGGGSKGGGPMLSVKMDRCCNRNWRVFLFISLVILAFLLTGMLYSNRNDEDDEQMLDTEWRNHWSEGQNVGSASKTVVEKKGKTVVETEEAFDEYLEDNEEDPMPDDNEYYDQDDPDRQKNRETDQDYLKQAQYDEQSSQKGGFQSAPLGVVPDIQDFSRNENFLEMFRKPLSSQDTIKFDAKFRNPCWSESIPKYPYQANSYLYVSQQARILEPQFQMMRRRFAQRTAPEDKWRQRCLPYYYVMETPPLAVPSLFTVLGYHPFVVNPAMSEPEFWNLRGPDKVAALRDYVDLFDNAAEEIRSNTTNVDVENKMELRHKKVTGDGTSSYLWTIDNWQKLPGNEDLTEPKVTTANLIHSVTPQAKIVIMLRNPTDRLFQGYLSRTENPSAADFHEKVGQAMEAMSKCEEQRSLRSCLYDTSLNKRLKVRLRIGMYYPFIEDYLKVFGKEQVKVIRYEDYISSTSEIINEVCAFLGLMPYPTADLDKAEKRVQAMDQKRKQAMKFSMMSTTRAMLKEFHKILNDKLAEILEDEKFKWPKLAFDVNSIPESELQQQMVTPRLQQQPQQGGQQSSDKPKSFREMLSRIRERQQTALSKQLELREKQLERVKQMRAERDRKRQERLLDQQKTNEQQSSNQQPSNQQSNQQSQQAAQQQQPQQSNQQPQQSNQQAAQQQQQPQQSNQQGAQQQQQQLKFNPQQKSA